MSDPTNCSREDVENQLSRWPHARRICFAYHFYCFQAFGIARTSEADDTTFAPDVHVMTYTNVMTCSSELLVNRRFIGTFSGTGFFECIFVAC